MSTEILTAIIAACISIASVGIGIYGQLRTTRLEHQLTWQRESESREAKAMEIMTKYREPLLRAAYDLQARLFRMAITESYHAYYFGTPDEKTYIIQNTMFVVAEYLGWVEILRREVQFLDLGDIDSSSQLSFLLENITEIFFADNHNSIFRLLRGEQRAIGEIMLLPRVGGENGTRECIGFATFVKNLDDPDFSRWWKKFQDDLDRFAKEPNDENKTRLILLQQALIDVIDFLDPEHARISEKNRQKIKLTIVNSTLSIST